MNRSDFQQLADVRIAESKGLLDAGFYDGAYYLAGYAVECGLKACVAKLTNQYDFPPRETRNYYTHNFDILMDVAGLSDAIDADATADTVLAGNWVISRAWSEQSRYERKTEAEARQLYAAVADPTHGILPWIKARW